MPTNNKVLDKIYQNRRFLLISLTSVITFVLIALIFSFSRNKSQIKGATFSASPITVKLMVVIYNPIIEAQGNRRLNQVKGWNDPDVLTAQIIADLKTASHGLVNYQVVKRVERDEWPITLNGTRYTDTTYFQDTSYKGLGNGDYNAIIRDNQIDTEVNAGNVDEVFMWGAPGFGWFESAMAGNGAFWINGGPISGVNSKAFVLMGLSYERGEAEALESYGHRTESTIRQVYGSWVAGAQSNDWEKFAELDRDVPGKGGIGNAHNAFNAEPGTDYNRTSTRFVPTSADDWYNFPNMTGTRTDKNCTAWGCTGNGYLLWWYDHMPHFDGQVSGIYNNWWEYIVDFNNSIINASPSPSPTPPPIAGDPSLLTATASCNGSMPVITFKWQDNSNFESGFWLDISKDSFNGPSNTSTSPSVWGVKGVYRNSVDMTAMAIPVQFAWDNEAPSLTAGPLESGDSDSKTSGSQLTPQSGSTYYWRVKAFNFTQGSNHVYPGAANPPGKPIVAASCP